MVSRQIEGRSRREGSRSSAAKSGSAAQKEPANWTMEMTDPRPNREGAAALYGYISNATETEPGAEAYYDNVVITPNARSRNSL